MSLQGRVALVTGASRGIGKATARLLATRGVAVAINGRSEQAEQTADELCRAGFRALAVVADVANKAQVEAMVAQIERELGPLWLLVNNAGVLNTGPTDELAEAAWDETFAVDAKGVFLCSQAVIRPMRARHAGRIINIASIAGLIPRINQVAYSSAKAAVIHFSRCLAIELAPHGITVNCVCPGMTRTELLLQSAQQRGLDLDAMVTLIPSGRMSEPADHAQLVAYFASEEAGQVTGQVVAVDGGQSQYFPFLPRPQ